MTNKATIQKLLNQACPNGKIRLKSYCLHESAIIYATGEAAVALGSRPLSLSVLVVKALSFAAIKDLSTLAASMSQTPLLVSLQSLSPKKQAALRKACMNYVDVSSNAYLQVDGIYVDRTGFVVNAATTPSATALASCFTDKATIVIRQLLETNGLGVQELVRTVQAHGFAITPGYVSKVAASFRAKGYLDKSKTGLCLIHKEDLLQDWVEAYRLLRHPKPDGWYCYTQNLPELARALGEQLQGIGTLTERSGAWLASPYAAFDSISIAVRDPEKAKVILQKFGAEPAERGANIFIGVPKYKESAFYDCRTIDGVPVVSNLQLYLDLSLQGKRGSEAMEHLYTTSLKQLLKD